MWAGLTRWRERRIITRYPISDDAWQCALDSAAMLQALSLDERLRLRDLSTLFLHRKQLVGAHGLEISPAMAATIAAQACLPILELGLPWYRRWQTVVVHADEFVARQVCHDADGLAHEGNSVMVGEAWEQGPIVLSWADIAATRPESADGGADGNVILHEFAHALDMLNGDANGFPPLHSGMNTNDWVAAFSAAYAHLCDCVDADVSTWPVDPYAVESPGECFAVLTETFFTRPADLVVAYPAVHAQLVAFYRQDPLRRGVGCSSDSRTRSTC